MAERPFVRGLLLAAWVAGAAVANTLAGKVVEERSGEALAGVEVRISRVGAAQALAEFETEAAGTFALPAATAGDYTLVVSKANYAERTLHVHLDAEETASVMLVRLVRFGAIAGRVLDAEGQPLRGARVVALGKPQDGEAFRPYRDFTSGHTATVDEQGGYRLHHLTPGQYAVAVLYGATTLAVGTSGHAETNSSVGSGLQFYPSNAAIRFFPVVDGEEFKAVDFSLLPSAGVSVSGQVTALRAPGRFWVALAPVSQPGLALGVTPTEEDGSFHLHGMPVGSYYVFASGPTTGRGMFGAQLDTNPLFGRTQVELAGAKVDGVAVTTASGGSASFTVRAGSTEAAKACPATVRLRLSPLEDWGANLERTIEIRLGAEQSLHDLAPGRYSVNVQNQGGENQAGECRLDKEVVVDTSKPNQAAAVVLTTAAQK